MSFHIAAMVIAVNLLSGIGFSYEVPNEENEVILLVDVSESNKVSRDEKDAFVSSVIDVCGDDCSIGIVKFGYGHSYAVELTRDKSGVFEKYTRSDDPDGSATALADALEYTASLFNNKKTSKIVVISDGLETDGNAVLALNEIVKEGTVVDTVTFSESAKNDIQIVSATVEEKNIVLKESFITNLVIKSNSTEKEEAAILRLYDNGELYGETVVGIKNGINEFPVSLAISKRGMHELKFELVTDHELFGDPLKDEVSANNSYRTYVNLQQFDNILLIERYEKESAVLKNILSETKTVTDISVEHDIASFPKTIEEIAEYEQVILVNIAYSDMPAGFEELLNRYVYELGGGLFTVGGRNDEVGGKLVPHAYNRKDLENSVYLKQMLPVNAIDFTPPVAVMIVIDTSTSMKSNGKLESATLGAKTCLDALQDRDFCGVISFSNASSERLSVLPVSQREDIEEAINKISEKDGSVGGGTVFSDAIMKAGLALSVINNVEKKHIILVTDGLPGDSYNDYSPYISDNVGKGITMSVVTIGLENDKNITQMQNTATSGGGKFYNVFDTKTLSETIYKDLTQEAIKEIEYGEEFSLKVKDRSTILAGINASEIPKLSGYYGTEAKKGATVPLVGEYVPIYATHKYGNGTVGSFMCDLNGTWSSLFVNDLIGKRIVSNIVDSIFPYEDVRVDGIKYELKSDNYSHWINIHGAPEGHRIFVSAARLEGDTQKDIAVNAAEGDKRFTFIITEPGLYKITITSSNAEGTSVNEIPIYTAFSYSEEYDTFSKTKEDGEMLMSVLNEKGNGAEISDPIEIFDSFSKTVVKEYDPRIILIIAAIVLVLLDIAVRKFKFKWIHELIRERKTNKL